MPGSIKSHTRERKPGSASAAKSGYMSVKSAGGCASVTTLRNEPQTWSPHIMTFRVFRTVGRGFYFSLCRCIIAPGIVGLSGNLVGTMDQNNIKNIVETHLGALEPECRWCFAIDMERVAGEPIDSCCFPDYFVQHFRCPRCGGEFTDVSPVYEMGYLKQRILRLYPHLSDIVDKAFAQDPAVLKKLGEHLRELPPESLDKPVILDVRCIDNTGEGRQMDYIYPELNRDDTEWHTVLDVLFHEYDGKQKK